MITLTKKVRLIIPKELECLFFKSAGASRYAYNWSISKDIDFSIKESDLRKEFTQFKKLEDNTWMKEINNNVFKQSIRDYYKSRNNYFKKISRKPSFKKKGKCKESFYIDVDQIKFYENNKVYIPSIGTVRYSGYNLPLYTRKVINKKIIYEGIKPSNPRITYDGIYWYLSVSYPNKEKKIDLIKNRTIGVDLGLKTFASICINDNGNKEFYEVSSLKYKYRKLEKRKRHLDRKISRLILKNKKKGEFTKSHNFKKLLKKRIKYNHKMTNIQKDIIYDTINFLVKSKPEKIIIEDLNIKGMMKNHRLSKWIRFNQFYNFRRILEYKCKIYGIILVIVDRFFPSSKLCSKCGSIRKHLSLSERVFKCFNCGFEFDRDLNASINLSNYA